MEIEALIEIAKGSRNKYEADHESGALWLDRMLFTATQYPADYGFVPGTLADDGDPIDVMVLLDEPTFPGCHIRARVVGVFHMRDEKGEDAKVLAVPATDPRWERVADLDDLPPHLLDEIAHFFEVYKDLEPGKGTVILGWENAAAAIGMVDEARAAHAERGHAPGTGAAAAGPAAGSVAGGDLDGWLAGCRGAHGRMRALVAGLDDATVRRPSRLPGWTVGHVLTHLARNADSHVRILEGALRGEHLEQYAGGPEQRASDIGAGAGRPAAALADDVVRSAERLEAAWARMTPGAWAGHGLSGGLPWPCRELPFQRWREVEVHLVDLGTGAEPSDWPEEYLRAELPRALAALPDRLEAGDRRRLLAWLLGRAEQPEGLELAPWQSRP